MVSFLQWGAKIPKQGGGAQDKNLPGYSKMFTDRASKLRFFKFLASNQNELSSSIVQTKSLLFNFFDNQINSYTKKSHLVHGILSK